MNDPVGLVSNSFLPHPLAPLQSVCPREACAGAHVLPTSMFIFSTTTEAESVGEYAGEWQVAHL